MRRVLLLIRALPADSYTKLVTAEAIKQAAEQAKLGRIRARQEHYRKREG